MDKIKDLEQQIEKLKRRNKKVDANKAWETSKFRIGTVAGIVYLVAVSLMWSLEVERAWLNAAIPAFGFILSTISLPPLKRWWLNNRYKNK